MVDNSRAIGLTTRWRGVVSSHGQIIEGTMESILMTRRKVSGSSTGLMAENTRDNGRMENNMDKVSIHLLQASQSVVNGLKERELPGYDYIIKDVEYRCLFSII